MRILITGHEGFIGSHFHRRLDVPGNEVWGFDTARSALEDVRQIAYWNLPRFDLVIHCAAVIGGRRMIDRQPLAVATNLAIDQALFSWACSARPGRILYLSSSAAYPVVYQQARSCGYALTETDIALDDVRTPDQTYGWAKLTGELLARQVTAEGVPVHIVRPFSGYSEVQSLDYPFPSFVDRARRHADPFVVWGDGCQVRDFIHVDDVISGALEVVAQDVQVPVNLGCGRPTAFDDLAAMCMAAAGYEAPIEHRFSEPSGVPYRLADTTRMLDIYRPTVTLEEGIERAISSQAAAA
jgi:nucleoside-diphosphate-sugar epimerase